jgi:hypothetical protein
LANDGIRKVGGAGSVLYVISHNLGEMISIIPQSDLIETIFVKHITLFEPTAWFSLKMPQIWLPNAPLRRPRPK